MKHLLEVYRELHNNGVFLFEQPLQFSNEETAAATVECDGVFGIFVDASKLSTYAEEAVTVSHEAGHCMTGSTHKLNSPYDLIERHENRADRWAIEKLVPEDELVAATDFGYTEIWQLADYFNVTEDFMKKAVCYYTYGNLAADLYF